MAGWVLVLSIAAAVFYWPRWGLRALWRSYREHSRRERYEDALKHILAWEHSGKTATRESLCGALQLSPREGLAIVTDMQTKDLLRVEADGLRLTPAGQRLGLHIVRAHRLFERYLADDAGMPMAKVHQAAEKAEHGLSRDALDELEAHLGHPSSDPHGDPIPASDGSIAALHAISLTDWPEGDLARIVHVEDEPAVIFEQIVAAGLRPGMTVRILERTPSRLVVSDGLNEHRLAYGVAANVQVAECKAPAKRQAGLRRLSELRLGEQAEVVEIDSECRGFSRRRLMDLGLTPLARVEVALDNTFGDPRAFRVRGTTIALRKQQTGHVWVKVAAGNARGAAA